MQIIMDKEIVNINHNSSSVYYIKIGKMFGYFNNIFRDNKSTIIVKA